MISILEVQGLVGLHEDMRRMKQGFYREMTLWKLSKISIFTGIKNNLKEKQEKEM